MSETLQPFHFREAFLDGKCIDIAEYIDGRLSVLVVNPDINGKANHQKHFLLSRETRKISNRLKPFCCCSFPPVYGEILFGFALPECYVDQCRLRALYG